MITAIEGKKAPKIRKRLPKMGSLKNTGSMNALGGGGYYSGMPRMGCDATQVNGCGKVSLNNCPNE